MAKIITLTGLQRFLTNLQTLIGNSHGTLTRNTYSYTATADGVQSFTIPNYTSSMIVDVFLNGLLLVPTTEYTISSAGVITTVNSISTGGVFTFFITEFS